MSVVARPMATVPDTFTMATEETWPIEFDTTNLGGSPTSPNVVLTDLDPEGGVVALADPPTTNGNWTAQILAGARLSRGTPTSWQ